MIKVIADDITGAAEIAGIGWRFGLNVSLQVWSGEEDTDSPTGSDLVVYATDTRSMCMDEAMAQTRHIGHAIGADKRDLIFKKTDSALRGHIVAELKVLMACTGRAKAMLLPQNPTKQRVVRGGIYYIDNTPLHQTSFADDPVFPAVTSDVAEYLGSEVRFLPSGAPVVPDGISIADASTGKEIEALAPLVDRYTLAAGGADFFTALLQSKGYHANTNRPFAAPADGALIVCGSTVKHNISSLPYIRRKQIPECNIPLHVFGGGDPEEWIAFLKKTYREKGSLIIGIDHPPQKGRAFAEQLNDTIRRATLSLLSEHSPGELIIEGGATAYTILSALKWRTFRVECEIAPGVIRIALTVFPFTVISLKPGSYSWGRFFD